MTQTQQLRTGTRTISWTSLRARPTSRWMLSLDGLGQLEALVEGKAPRPPFMDTLDICGFEPERGRVVVELRAQEFHYNPLGTVHGGVLATLLDTAAGCAVHSTLAVGRAVHLDGPDHEVPARGHPRLRAAHL